ncbi:DAK2 domain-containing protein [Ligilactobacillus ceti]|uniref:DAK2 domain-containing protein n=1 Tax=Ligilactobacillus ceti TaxID=395085 RepID=UPI00041510D9|nr:DAK2 domain-containing protein [Ligilactobacillus ceti]
MKVANITEVEFRKMVKLSSDRLNKHAELIDSLNVFPVPDGDTGTNMSLSMTSGNQYVAESTATSVGELTTALAKGLLMGARGNSGVILSQIFRGFNKAVKTKEVLTAQDLSDALSGGAEVAYKAVMKPKEGTILTVARKAAEGARKAVKESDDVLVVMEAAYNAAEEALANTPNQLPVLKEVGVVDSGGKGLTYVYQSFFDILAGNDHLLEVDNKISEKDMEDMIKSEHHKSVQGQMDTEDIKYGYCTEIMVRLGAGRLVDREFDYDEFRNHLAELGDSLLVVADDEVVKVHVHTEHPGDVFNYGQHFGSLIKMKVDNMRLQHETILETQDTPAAPAMPVMKNDLSGDYGIIAISSGKGISELFQGLGANYIVSGGQTMNPSTEDIVAAIDKTGAEKVIILPNNKNILLAAQQAAEVAEVEVAVIPSATIAQGMAALFVFNKDASLAENAEAMTENLEYVTSGQVTTAVRDTTIDGQVIKKDEFMGIIDGKIKLTEKTALEAAIAMSKEMIDDDSEVITIIFGEDGTQAEAEEIKEAILAIDEDLEVEIHAGNQPVYPYLISVE